MKLGGNEKILKVGEYVQIDKNSIVLDLKEKLERTLIFRNKKIEEIGIDKKNDIKFKVDNEYYFARVTINLSNFNLNSIYTINVTYNISINSKYNEPILFL